MPAANKIYIQVDLESKDAEKAVDEVNKKIKEIGETTEKTSVKASGGVKRITASVEQSAGSMEKLASAISALGLAEIGRQAFKIADDLNRMRLGFENLEGGASMFRLLRKVAAETGFAITELARGAQDLIDAGTAPGLVAKQMRILSDAAARAGKDVQVVLNITEKMRLVGLKGFISNEDVSVYGKAGINLNNILKTTEKLSQQQLQKSFPMINAGELMRIALEEAEKQAKGAAAARARVLPSAALEQFKNKAIDLATDLEHTLAPALISVIDHLSELLKLVGKGVEWFDRLPAGVKQAAVSMIAFAAAVKAVSVAFGLWKALPSIGAMAGGIRLAQTAIAGMATTIGAATYGLGAMEAATVTLSVAMKGLVASLPVIGAVTLALGAAYLAYQEYIGKPAAAAAEANRNKGLEERNQLLKQSGQLERALSKAGGSAIPAPKGVFKINPDDQVALQESIDLTREWNAEMSQALQKRQALIQANEDELKRATEYGAKLLADTMRDQLKIGQETVAALGFAWQEHWKNTEKSAKGASDAAVAFGEAVVTESLKQIEIVKNARIKANEDAAAAARKLAISYMEAIPDTSPVGQQQLAELRYETAVMEAQAKAQAAIRIDRERMEKQVQAVPTETAKAALHAKTPQDVMAMMRSGQIAIDNFRQAHDQQVAIQEEQFEREKAQALIEMQKAVIAADFALEKENREALAQIQIDSINRVRDYEVATATLVEAHTRDEKLAQIEIVQDANLAAITKTAAVQEASLRGMREQYKRFLDLAKEIGVLSQPQLDERLKAYDDVMNRQINAINEQAAHEGQMVRIEAWRAGNQVIIDEQRQVYESIAGVMGELFDAFFDKNKSVWSAIGDVIKRTILGALKSVVTSRLAAAFAGMLGYGNVSFAGGPLGQQTPVFGGMGTPPFAPSGAGGSASSSIGFASRMISSAVGAVSQEVRSAPASSGGALVPGAGMGILTESYVGSAPSAYMGGGDWGNGQVLPTRLPGGGSGGYAGQMAQMKESFNIGKPVRVRNPVTGMVETKPWSSLTGRQRLSAIMTSPGMAAIATTVGLPMFMNSLGKKGVAAGAMGIAGGALTGWGLAAMFPALGLNPLGGAIIGAGAGLFAAGYKRRGWGGLAMTAAGGLIAGAGIGATIGGLVGGPLGAAAGLVVGAAVGAAVGIGVGVVNLFRKSKEQQVRQLIRQTYGVDISDQNILTQVVEVAKQRFGGDVRMAVHSTEVQEMVRIYTLMTGQNANLPRQQYPATFAQSASGGVQLQPVYSGGRMLANPYTGTTTAQVANALEYSQSPVFMQLNPQQASSLFAGQVVQVMGNNPGAVAGANTTAARSGQGRTAQSSALLEPATVMA